MSRKTVGVIGLGAMGAGIAKTLRDRGFEVVVCDARPGVADAFASDGGVACRFPSEVAERVGVLVSVVVNALQTEDVLFGERGAAQALKPGSSFIMCSTVDPNWSIALEGRLNAMQLHYVDAPISGGAARAASGQMTMMTSARPEAYAACNEVLDAMAGTVYRLGDRAGAGSKVKIINQLLAGVHIAVAAEAMALGLREGVDADALYEVITHSAGNSWMFENRMAHVIAGDYTPLSAVDIFVKDLGLVLDTARASRFPLPLAATAHQMFMQASTAGFGREDDSAVIKIFPGITLPTKKDDKATTPTTSPGIRVTPASGQAPVPESAPNGKRILLGCIADDFTGATDLANNLVRAGMRVVQTIGVPSGPLDAEADAVVVALKSRTIPAQDAIHQSLAALRWLQAQGARQFYFKYCSTFDSTSEGNIGPVTEALMDVLKTPFTIATPAFPDNKRTVFKGYLFAGEGLLNESGMQNHPLTPMTDPNLVRVMQAQTKRRVGLIDYRVVAQGEQAIRARIGELKAEGVGVAIVDAISNDDLLRMAPALKDLPLLTAGSGVAIGLPGNFGLAPSSTAAALPAASGLQAIVSGSCSVATNGQVADFIKRGGEATAIDPLRIAAGVDVAAEVLAWAESRIDKGPVLVYSTAEPHAVKRIQRELGVEKAGSMVEQVIAAIARGLVERGVRQLVVAGGETSGACVQALDIAQMRIGAQIDPGVPWCHAVSPVAPDGLHITLKSGNFGTVDFFTKAFEQLKTRA